MMPPTVPQIVKNLFLMNAGACFLMAFIAGIIPNPTLVLTMWVTGMVCMAVGWFAPS